MRAPLPLGRVVATPGALKLLSEASEDLFGYLARHATGDWGELCAFDRRQNEIALREGYRVLSSYEVGGEASGSSPRQTAPSPPSFFQRSTKMSCELWWRRCVDQDLPYHRGIRLLVCDPCYEENSSVLVIVPGDRVVMAGATTAGATATPESSWRSALEGARTPTRGRVGRARRGRGS